MSRRIIAAGHVCLDITPVFDAGREYRNISDILEPGKLINVGAADVHTGGSVANTGLALKKMGVDVGLMGKIGNDAFGDTVKKIFGDNGASGLIVDERCQTSYSVVVAIPGIDRIFLHNPGANDFFTSEDIKDEAISDASLFHLGYPPLMRGLYEADGAELVRIFKRVKNMGLLTSLDMAAVDPSSEAGRVNWEKVLALVLPYVDFFVPSFEEICFMLNRPRYDELAKAGADVIDMIDIEADVEPLARQLIGMGSNVVLIKCGTKGIFYMTSGRESLGDIVTRTGIDAEAWSDKRGLVRCFRAPRVLSATGAGDASIAAFLAAAMEGRDIVRCVELAAAQGACAVTAYDAISGLKTLDELDKMIDDGLEVL